MSEVLQMIPAELRAAVLSEIARQGVDESAWLEDAVRLKLAADEEIVLLASRAARGGRESYERALSRVPDAALDPGDDFLR